jgi:hypothetical protein
VQPPPSQPIEDAGAPVVVPWDAGATSEAGVSGASVLNECVGAINALRGQNDLEAYEVSTDLEAFAASAAAADAASGEEDGYFDGSQQSVSFGEDELLGSQLDPTGSALQVLEAAQRAVLPGRLRRGAGARRDVVGRDRIPLRLTRFALSSISSTVASPAGAHGSIPASTQALTWSITVCGTAVRGAGGMFVVNDVTSCCAALAGVPAMNG